MKDYKLNPDKEYVLKIIEGIYRKQGRIETIHEN